MFLFIVNFFIFSNLVHLFIRKVFLLNIYISSGEILSENIIMATEINSIETPKEPSAATDLKDLDKKNNRTVTRVFPIAELTILELLKTEILKVSQLEKPHLLCMNVKEDGH